MASASGCSADPVATPFATTKCLGVPRSEGVAEPNFRSIRPALLQIFRVMMMVLVVAMTTVTTAMVVMMVTRGMM
eukprot:12837703-Alexandrium_andersonii.AAC.1